jgi:hypothetical protein
MNRRDFLSASGGAALFATLPGELLAQAANPPASSTWNAGALRHLLPTVSDSAMLIKASFAEPLGAAPTLRIGTTNIAGRMTDTAGQFWQFLATGLPAGQKQSLSLVGADGRVLCEP